MRSGLPFKVSPVELMHALKRDVATFLGAEERGYFLPRLALLPLLADELRKRFEAAAISTSATTPFIFGIRIHSCQFRPADVDGVSE